MKHKTILLASALSLALLFTGCAALFDTTAGTTTDQTEKTTKTTETTGNVLGDILDAVIGRVPLSQKNMLGTWNFQGTSCAFETENLLKKAGGAVVATQVEAKFDEVCQKMKINSSNTSFKFNADSTYTGLIGGVKISGKYQLDPDAKKVRMSYMLGVAHLDASVAVSRTDMKLLFDADAILRLFKFVSKFTNDPSIEVLGKMADMYDGMLLGFDLRKQTGL